MPRTSGVSTVLAHTNVISVAEPLIPQISLFGEIFPTWGLTRTLLVSVQPELDGSYIFSDDVFKVYGVGDTVLAAYRDYITSLVEFYELTEASVKTNPYDKPLFDQLKAYLRRISNMPND